MKRAIPNAIIRMAIIALVSVSCIAQTVHLTPVPRVQFLDNNGHPLKGGFLYTYQVGTTTNQNTYTDSTGASANTNPIVLDSGGFANVWLSDGLSYKLCLQNSLHVPQYCIDGVTNPAGGTSGAFNPASPPAIGNTLPSTIDGTVITAHTNFIGNLNGNVTGNVGGTLTGNVNGNVTGTLTGNVIGGTVSGTTITASSGFNGPLTGNVTGSLNGNVTGNVTGNVSGNASTATSATTATTANNALALTGLIHFRTSATCTTGTSGGTQCTTTFTAPYTYSSAGSWDIVCTGIGQTGSPYVLATAPQSGTTFNAVIGNTSVTGVGGSYASLSCIAYGN